LIFKKKPAQQIFTGELEGGPKDYGPEKNAHGPFFTSHKQVQQKKKKRRDRACNYLYERKI